MMPIGDVKIGLLGPVFMLHLSDDTAGSVTGYMRCVTLRWSTQQMSGVTERAASSSRVLSGLI